MEHESEERNQAEMLSLDGNWQDKSLHWQNTSAVDPHSIMEFSDGEIFQKKPMFLTYVVPHDR